MNVLLKVRLFLVLFLSFDLAKAEEIPPLINPMKENIPAGFTSPPAAAGFSNIPAATDHSKETALPDQATEELHPVTLDDMIKQVMQDSKVLSAKTELVAGKKTYLIKVLTPMGHIQHIKIDAMTGKTLDKLEK